MPSLRADCAEAEHCAELLKALAHAGRLRIIAALCEEDHHVNGLVEVLGLPQAVVSQQLRILRLRKLVAPHREGGFTRYTLAEPRLRELIGCIRRCASPIKD